VAGFYAKNESDNLTPEQLKMLILYRTNFVIVCHFERQREIFPHVRQISPRYAARNDKQKRKIIIRSFCPVEKMLKQIVEQEYP